jgi:conjugative transposon TraK protein
MAIQIKKKDGPSEFAAHLGTSEVVSKPVIGQTQVLKVDSVVCDFNAYPYRAVTYATQKIIRQSNVTERSLVTTCRLLNASRSDDNPNGFTIEGFTIIENKDLQTIKR